MVKKKLLTLAGVAGILACGACFLPPLPQKKLPLPLALASVHRIAIRVEDVSQSNIFDARTMSYATAADFNQYWSNLPLKALDYYAGEPVDATLKITVLGKTFSCPKTGKEWQYCTFVMSASYLLTAADGRVLQSRPQENVQFRVWSNGAEPPVSLNDNRYRWDVSRSLAITAGHLFRPSKSSE